MQKLIAIITGCSLALAVSLQAAEPTEQVNAKKQSQKNKVQKQQFTPKQQQLKTQNMKTQNTHVQKVQKTPVVQSNTLPAVQTKKFEKNKEHLQTTNQHQIQTNTQQFQKNKLSQQSITKIKSQHVNFHATPKSAIVSVQFNQNYKIKNAQNWNGAHYSVYKSYHPQWHDQGWWISHHHHLSLISGGWYFWDGGYWYPAWGYDSGAAYYPYDGPIYSGPTARPLDQLVADVQAALQEQGFYKGEVDGLMGPLTRQALAEYQSANGLYATETIDQPTLSSLGLAG